MLKRKKGHHKIATENSTDSQTSVNLVEKANNYIARQEFTKAKSCYLSLLSLNPDNATAKSHIQFLEAFEHEQNYNIDKAFKGYYDSIQKMENLDIIFKIAEYSQFEPIIYEFANKYDEVIKLHKDNQYSYDFPKDTLIKMAVRETNNGCYADSLLISSIVLGAYPLEEKALIEKAFCYFNKGQYQLAIKYYDYVLKVDKNNMAAVVNKGIALSRLNQPKEALICFDEALAFDSEDEAAIYNKKIALSQLATQIENHNITPIRSSIFDVDAQSTTIECYDNGNDTANSETTKPKKSSFHKRRKNKSISDGLTQTPSSPQTFTLFSENHPKIKKESIDIAEIKLRLVRMIKAEREKQFSHSKIVYDLNCGLMAKQAIEALSELLQGKAGTINLIDCESDTQGQDNARLNRDLVAVKTENGLDKKTKLRVTTVDFFLQGNSINSIITLPSVVSSIDLITHEERAYINLESNSVPGIKFNVKELNNHLLQLAKYELQRLQDQPNDSIAIMGQVSLMRSKVDNTYHIVAFVAIATPKDEYNQVFYIDMQNYEKTHRKEPIYHNLCEMYKFSNLGPRLEVGEFIDDVFYCEIKKQIFHAKSERDVHHDTHRTLKKGIV